MTLISREIFCEPTSTEAALRKVAWPPCNFEVGYEPSSCEQVPSGTQIISMWWRYWKSKIFYLQIWIPAWVWPSSIFNIFDKGYRCVLAAKAEDQQCLQPVFAKSDQQFRAGETLYSGCVAVVRSGNERAVNRCKMSWFLKRGTKDQSWDHSVLADVWLAWGFQVNLMYDKCL